MNGLANSPADKNDWKIINSLTKPLNGGSAAIAIEPIRKMAAVRGMSLIKPPMRSMFLVPVAWATDPAVMKSRLLNSAWLMA